MKIRKKNVMWLNRLGPNNLTKQNASKSSNINTGGNILTLLISFYTVYTGSYMNDGVIYSTCHKF